MRISDRVYPGLVWMALHFAEAKVNWLTHDVGDPLIGTPEYKISAVRVEPVVAAAAPPHADGRLARTGRRRPARQGSLRAAVHVRRVACESTQLLCSVTALPEGAVAATDLQTAGRGRYGRAWEAPAGRRSCARSSSTRRPSGTRPS